MIRKLEASLMSAKILVVGSTGDLGSVATRMLLSKQRNVRILVRPQSNFKPLVEAGAEPVFGDLKDPVSLDQALRGIQYVVTTANSAKRNYPDTALTVDCEGNRNLINASKNMNVKQFIFVSLSTADINSPIQFVQCKAKTEDYLQHSGLQYTIVAPNAFMETWIALVIGVPAVTGQPVTIVGGGKRKHSFISLMDVAKFIVASIDNPMAFNKRLVIGGPHPISLLESVGAFESVLRRKIPIVSVSPGQPVPGLPPQMAEMLAGLEFFDSPIEMGKLSRAYGIELTSMQEYAKQFISQFRKKYPSNYR